MGACCFLGIYYFFKTQHTLKPNLPGSAHLTLTKQRKITNIMLKISNLNYPLVDEQHLEIKELTVTKGQSLLVVGDNASGKSVLAQILSGAISDYQGNVNFNVTVASLSFELEAQTLAFDRKNDDSEFTPGGVDLGRTAKQVILQLDKSEEVPETEQFNSLMNLLAIDDLLTKPFKVLSTGETRKVLLAKALMSSPQLLILDEPYAGLDIASQAHLTLVLEQLIAQGISIILFDFYHASLPASIDQLIYLQAGSIVLSGERQQLVNSPRWQALTNTHYSLPHHLPDCLNYQHLDEDCPLVEMKNVSVSFNEQVLFSDLNWCFTRGQHWRIKGPNGCGKSTLLAMISGDSTKAYGKDIHLFGVKRGSGESVWDIKRHYGTVSAQLHSDYRASTTLLETVLSGFFDSIGLYDRVEKSQINIAKEWLVLLGLSDKENYAFSQLSYGEQRLALIARAVVKLPMVLILDEPCQGLDNKNRAKVLALVDYIASRSRTNILFVSHDVRDVLTCLTDEMEFTAQGHIQLNKIR